MKKLVILSLAVALTLSVSAQSKDSAVVKTDTSKAAVDTADLYYLSADRTQYERLEKALLQSTASYVEVQTLLDWIRYQVFFQDDLRQKQKAKKGKK